MINRLIILRGQCKSINDSHIEACLRITGHVVVSKNETCMRVFRFIIHGFLSILCGKTGSLEIKEEPRKRDLIKGLKRYFARSREINTADI